MIPQILNLSSSKPSNKSFKKSYCRSTYKPLNISFINSLKSERGQGLIEYLILVALVAVGSIAVVRVLGTNIARQYENINIALGADTDRARTRPISSPQNATEKKDLSNFLNGAASHGESKGKNDGK